MALLPFAPLASGIGEGTFVDDARDGAIDLLPHAGKWRIGLAARASLGGFAGLQRSEALRPQLKESSGSREQYPPSAPAAGFDEASLLEPGEDELEKLLGNFLAVRDARDFDRFGRDSASRDRRWPGARIRL